MIDFNEVITDYNVLANRYIRRDGFVFTAINHPGNVYDAIVIKNPSTAYCFSPRVIGSTRSLQEQIDLINKYKIEKALIVADDIYFILQCPSLKHFRIIPSDNFADGFD